MKRRQLPLLVVFGLFIAGILAACTSTAEPEVIETIVQVTRVVTETTTEDSNQVTTNDEGIVADTAEGAANSDNTIPRSQSNRQSQRLIIKNGEMTITVQDADQALERAIDTAVEFGGYVISQRSWAGNGDFRYGRVQMGVPVADFEAVMKALRTLGTVTNEEASGQDVTDEFVDLNSRLENLEATQIRLRTFLEQAENVTETLTVNAELTKIEEELGVIQGRMNFLSDRAAFSTITVDLNPYIPTSTPSPTPTATPLPTAEAWLPSDTAKTAAVSLRNTSQNTADFVIYNGIVCGPWLVLFGLIGLVVFKVRVWWLRREEMPPSIPPTPAETPTD